MVAVEESKKANELAPRNSGTLSKQKHPMLIGSLEAALLKKFPAAHAEDWDYTGLLVGDPSLSVRGVAVALDPTLETIHQAKTLGANVLLTHHPAFLTAPKNFVPAESVLQNPGAGVWTAINEGIALMCFHTALDVSVEASQVLPKMLNLQFKKVLQPIEGNPKLGYGQLCTLRSSEKSLSFGQLAARCTSVFGRQPRAWGDFNRPLSRIVTCTGSLGDMLVFALNAGVDCIVCGEIRYHDALNAAAAGISVLDLGHDSSELPLVAVLAASAESVLGNKDQIMLIDQSSNWAYPESVRV